MHIEATPLVGALLLRPQIIRDDRGHFLETWSQTRYETAGVPSHFVQDNVSLSARGVVRGLHAQAQPHAQGKLVSVIAGAVFDVVVDVRRGSPTFGRWHAVELRAEDGTQFWIPPGFLHGFQAIRDQTLVLYKCSALYESRSEFGVVWNDPTLAIQWPLPAYNLSAKDASAPRLDELDSHLLFDFTPA